MYKRSQYQIVTSRMKEPRHFIQVLVGPRQVGKTTLVKQVIEDIDIPCMTFSADSMPATQTSWISDCWENTRAKMKAENLTECILVIDEIQKINNWSETVKKEWDADTWNNINIKVMLLGSSRIMLQHGLSESLMGRFEEIRMPHWSYAEMHDAFGFTLDEFIYFGGYPGCAFLKNEEERWLEYVQSTIVDATINKDILYNSAINKPALLRQTFELGSAYSGKIVSLTKMLGALQDAGNTTTLSGYVNLLNNSGLLTSLQKYSIDASRRRASIPKFQVYNNALHTIFSNKSFSEALSDHKSWGTFFESAVGTHLINNAFTDRYNVYYWRENNDEVDFVIRKSDHIAAIEVKSNHQTTNKGLSVFREKFKPQVSFVVGEGGIKAEEFFNINPSEFLK
jgi:predicted AAA+ superfamily ATPase